MVTRIVVFVAAILVLITSEPVFARKSAHVNTGSAHNLRHKKQAEGFAIVLTRTLLKKLADTRSGKTESKIAPRQEAHASPQVLQLHQNSQGVVSALAPSANVLSPTVTWSPPRHALLKSLFLVVISPNAP